MHTQCSTSGGCYQSSIRMHHSVRITYTRGRCNTQYNGTASMTHSLRRATQCGTGCCQSNTWASKCNTSYASLPFVAGVVRSTNLMASMAHSLRRAHRVQRRLPSKKHLHIRSVRITVTRDRCNTQCDGTIIMVVPCEVCTRHASPAAIKAAVAWPVPLD